MSKYVLDKYAIICKFKYAFICIKYAKNMQKYAVTAYVFLLCNHMHLYAKNMQIYVKYVSMKYICKICTPHFADGDRRTLRN